MKVVKCVEKDVKACAQCPYFHLEADMGAHYACCELLPEYLYGLPDVTQWSAGDKISKECPYYDEAEASIAAREALAREEAKLFRQRLIALAQELIQEIDKKY